MYDKLVTIVNTIQTTSTSNLVKKADYDSKIDETEKKITNHDHHKCITTQESNKLKTKRLKQKLRLKQTKLATKDEIDDFVKKTNFDEKLLKKTINVL